MNREHTRLAASILEAEPDLARRIDAKTLAGMVPEILAAARVVATSRALSPTPVPSVVGKDLSELPAPELARAD